MSETTANDVYLAKASSPTTWGTAALVSSNVSLYPTVTFHNDAWGNPNLLRTGPQYSFAVGNTDRPIRAAVTKWSNQWGEFYVQGIGCTSSLACEEPPEWSTLSFQVSGAGNFNPVVASYPGFVLDSARFVVQYESRTLDPGGTSVLEVDSRLDRENGGYISLAFNPIAAGQDICPDTRNYNGGGYWGDYNDVTWMGADVAGQTGYTFLSAVTDSTDGCASRQAYTSTYQNLSSRAFAW